VVINIGALFSDLAFPSQDLSCGPSPVFRMPVLCGYWLGGLWWSC